jgi:hypothetical protein
MLSSRVFSVVYLSLLRISTPLFVSLSNIHTVSEIVFLLLLKFWTEKFIFHMITFLNFLLILLTKFVIKFVNVSQLISHPPIGVIVINLPMLFPAN